MKEIFFLLLLILIGFSNEFWNIKCPPDKIKVCGCWSCYCQKRPKCSEGEEVRCNPRPPRRCFCEKKGNSTKSN